MTLENTARDYWRICLEDGAKQLRCYPIHGVEVGTAKPTAGITLHVISELTTNETNVYLYCSEASCVQAKVDADPWTILTTDPDTGYDIGPIAASATRTVLIRAYIAAGTVRTKSARLYIDLGT